MPKRFFPMMPMTNRQRGVLSRAFMDELLWYRVGGDIWENIQRRVVEKLVDEEFARRIAEGTVLEVAMLDGETGYVRNEEP